MIEEAYISYPTAVLLKEKGFDIPCTMVFYEGGEHPVLRHLPLDYDYECPTQQMAMRWLREVHNLHITITVIYTKSKKPRFNWFIENFVTQETIVDTDFVNNEEACEAAIKYCLENLI